MKLRTDPARVRLALAFYDLHGLRPTMREFNLSSRSVIRWIQAREEHGPDWPTLDLDRQWIATRDQREHRAANLRRWRARSYINRGPLLVDTTGTVRRLRALMAIGWTAERIAEHGPWDTGEALLIISKRDTVHVDTRDRVAAIYEQLCMTPGPSARTRRYAASKGWAPPLAWDNIDDPDETPALPETRRDGPRTAAERSAEYDRDRAARLEDLWFLARTGESFEFAARRLGVGTAALDMFLRNHDRELLAVLTANGRAAA